MHYGLAMPQSGNNKCTSYNKHSFHPKARNSMVDEPSFTARASRTPAPCTDPASDLVSTPSLGCQCPTASCSADTIYEVPYTSCTAAAGQKPLYSGYLDRSTDLKIISTGSNVISKGDWQGCRTWHLHLTPRRAYVRSRHGPTSCTSHPIIS